MSSELVITFGADMPPATVEIVAPDLEILNRVVLGPGTLKSVNVPSDDVFLRVHLPSGKVFTLQNKGVLNRLIDLDTLALTEGGRFQKNIRKLHDDPTYLETEQMTVPSAEPLLSVQLHESNGDVIPGCDFKAYEKVRLPEVRSLKPVYLEVLHEGYSLQVNLPGILSEVYVRAISTKRDKRLVRISVQTGNPIADTMGGYIARGDLNSASAMASWASQASELLFEKMEDPFSAAQGAYLLLRLNRFDLMHTWARNLANFFPELADGSVIWAWQQIYERGPEDTIQEYLFKAASNRRLPVFTEGLKLLGNGLRLLGVEGLERLRKLETDYGQILWNSPFTASVKRDNRFTDSQIRFEVVYDPPDDMSFDRSDGRWRMMNL